MDLGLSQKEAARRIGADPWTVINWENGRTEPAVRFVPANLGFLGYDPLLLGETFQDRLRAYRRRLGRTQAKLGRLAGVSEGTVYDLEHGRPKSTSPSGVVLGRLLLDE